MSQGLVAVRADEPVKKQSPHPALTLHFAMKISRMVTSKG
jgi:hypothetical protein